MPIMFKKLPFIGNLELEKTLYCRTEPEVFVCKDEFGKRYLCVAQSTPGQWLIGRINTKSLVAVLKDHLGLYETLRGCRPNAVITGLAGKYRLEPHIPDSAYPSGERFLQLISFDWGVQEYCELLSQELKS